MPEKTDLLSRFGPLSRKLGGVGIGFLLGVLGNVLCLLAVVGLYSVLPAVSPGPHALTKVATVQPPSAPVVTDVTGAREAVAVSPATLPAKATTEPPSAGTDEKAADPVAVRRDLTGPSPAPTTDEKVTATPSAASPANLAGAPGWPRKASFPEVEPAASPAPAASAGTAPPVTSASPETVRPVTAPVSAPVAAIALPPLEPPPAPPTVQRPVEVKPPEPPPVTAALPPLPSSAAPAAPKKSPALVAIRVLGVHATASLERSPAPVAGHRYVVVEISMQDAPNTLQLSEGHFEIHDQTGNIYYARTDLGTPWIVISPGVTLTGNIIFEVPQQVVPQQLAFVSHGSPVTVDLTSISPQ